MNPKTIRLTTKGVARIPPRSFHEEVTRSLGETMPYYASVVAHWPEKKRSVAITVNTLSRISSEERERQQLANERCVSFVGVVNNNSLFDDDEFRSVPVIGQYNIDTGIIRLTFDADCPPTEIDFAM